MGKFTAGLLTGGLLAAAGLCYTMSDPKMKRQIMKKSKKAARAADDLLDDVADKLEEIRS